MDYLEAIFQTKERIMNKFSVVSVKSSKVPTSFNSVYHLTASVFLNHLISIEMKQIASIVCVYVIENDRLE